MANAIPLHPAHLAAIRAAQAGDSAAASRMFLAAPAAVQCDVRFITDYAAFATAVGDAELASALYARAIAATARDAPPLRLRHALAMMDAGRLIDAIAMLEDLTRDHPQSATAWQALGAAQRGADRAASAAASFDRVLAIVPADPLARLSRAQMLDELGRPSTAAFVAALAVAPDNMAARLGLAAAQARAGQPGVAAATLRNGLARMPTWAEGWAALASIAHRWEGRAAGLEAIDEALSTTPGDETVVMTMLRHMATMAGADRLLTALPRGRATFGDTLPLALVEAQAASEAGDVARADAAFGRLLAIEDPVVLLARLRHGLRAGRPDEAAAIGQVMLGSPASRFAVPYLGTAWRLLDDPRYTWLEGDPRLVGTYDLALDPSDLDAVATELRTLHTARFPPYEQSMRGGTQTEGLLLSRQSPAIRTLRGALDRAIRLHIDQLPPVDITHPTLSQPRGAFRYAGSWSVRLSGGGHHVNHVHSEGWLSSACYIALPAGMAGTRGAQEDGWLTLGQPPDDLGVDLPPMRTVRPVAGQVVLFPSTMWHGTRPTPAGERLTVAFDVQPLT